MPQRRLVLIRHAKAGEAERDIIRPLTPRGHRDARAIGNWLRDAGIAPDRVVVSPSRRTHETWQDAADQLSGDPEVVIDDRIYDNDIDGLLEIVHELPDAATTVALVGHNPSTALLADLLVDDAGDADAVTALRDGYPTSGIAVFVTSAAWSDVNRASARLVSFVAPRDSAGGTDA